MRVHCPQKIACDVSRSCGRGSQETHAQHSATLQGITCRLIGDCAPTRCRHLRLRLGLHQLKRLIEEVDCCRTRSGMAVLGRTGQVGMRVCYLLAAIKMCMDKKRASAEKISENNQHQRCRKPSVFTKQSHQDGKVSKIFSKYFSQRMFPSSIRALTLI